MPIFASGFVAGILLLCSLSQLPPVYLVAGLPLLWLLRRPHGWVELMLWGMVSGLLWSLMSAQLRLDSILAADLERQDLLVQGYIASIPELNDKRIRFDFVPDPEFPGRENIFFPQRIRLSWYEPDSVVHSGERWQFSVRLKRPHGFMNPGGFDYEGYLFQQGIGATGYVRRHSENKPLAAAGFSLNRFRESLAARIKTALNGSSATGVVLALVLGIRSDISQDQWRHLTTTGTNHLMAISGLHIGLVSGLVFWLVAVVWKRFAKLCLRLPAPKAAAMAAGIAALVYAAMAGFAIPTQRALIMLAVIIVTLLLGRPVRGTTTLSLALLLVLLFDPFAVLAPGFWLSFFAVAVIFWMTGFRSQLPKWQQWGLLQAVLSLTLLPVTIWFFQRASLIAPLTNFLAVPLVGFLIVPLALSGALLLPLFPAIGTGLLMLVAYLLEGLMKLLKLAAGLPLSQLSLPQPAPIILLLAVAGVGILLLPRGLSGRYLGALLLLPLLLNSPVRPETGAFRVTVLDVGQGLSIVVQTAEHSLLFDAGARFSSNFNAGDAVVLPFLRHEGVSHLDRFVVSHADNDHRGGMEAVLAAVSVDQLLTSDQSLATEHDGQLCQAGQRWIWDNVEFSVLHPQPDLQASKNDAACVIRIANDSGSFLLTADIEKKAEQILLQQIPETLVSTVMLVPHHGSKTSSTLAFVQAVAPRLALLSVGYLNSFGFPRPEIVERYRKQGIELLDTATSGALIVDFPRTGDFRLEAYRWHHSHFWHASPVKQRAQDSAAVMNPL